MAKMTKDEALRWVMQTYVDVGILLNQNNIPYEIGVIRYDPGTQGIFSTFQYVFPWCEGDVVVGTLHAEDDYVISGISKQHCPSIETYRFPWDGNDITVFDTPEQFIQNLKTYYEETIAAKTTELVGEQN